MHFRVHFSLTASGLQKLLDTCENYARKWRLKFSIMKTQCFTYGKSQLRKQEWFLYNQKLPQKNTLNILGVELDNKSFQGHVDAKCKSAQRAMWSKSKHGFEHPGLDADTKTYIWKTCGLPALTYAMHCLDLKSCQLKQLDSTQAGIMKSCLGLSKFARSTFLLDALSLPKTSEIVNNNLLGLWYRICKSVTPSRELSLALLSRSVIKNQYFEGTLLERVCKVSHVHPAESFYFRTKLKYEYLCRHSGLTDSIKFLLSSHSYDTSLLRLLTRSF